MLSTIQNNEKFYLTFLGGRHYTCAIPLKFGENEAEKEKGISVRGKGGVKWRMIVRQTE